MDSAGLDIRFNQSVEENFFPSLWDTGWIPGNTVRFSYVYYIWQVVGIVKKVIRLDVIL